MSSGKSSSAKNTNSNLSKKRRAPRGAVQVVECPSLPSYSSSFSRDAAAGESNKKRSRHDRDNNYNSKSNYSTTKERTRSAGGVVLDLHETARQVHALGATMFEKQQKRNYKDEQYLQLTGRLPKKQAVPRKIVAGIQKKARKRQQEAEAHAKEAGLVVAQQPNKKTREQSKQLKRDRFSSSSSSSRGHGPAPSVGFMKKGVLRVNPNRK